MPGYSIESPAAAFSGGLESFLAQRQAQAMAQQRMAMEQQQAQQRAEAAKQQMALRQQEMDQRKAEFADSAQRRSRNDFAGIVGTMQPGDIPSADIVEQGQELGLGHLFQAPQESLPGIAAVPLVTATDEGQHVLPVEDSAQQGITPTSAAMRFRGSPAQRETESSREALRLYAQDLPEGTPQRTAAEFAQFGKAVPAAALRIAAAPKTAKAGSFEDYVTRLAPNGDPSQLSPEQIEQARAKWSALGRAPKAPAAAAATGGGIRSSAPREPDLGGLSPAAVEMKAWQGIATGKEPPIGRTEAAKSMYTAITNKMAELRETYNISEGLADNEATFKAMQSALASQTKMSVAAQNAARTAIDNLDLAGQASPRVTRTDAKFVNQIAQSFVRGATPAAALTDFETKIYTAVREYAKVASGSSASIAGLSDTATKEAERLLNAAQSPAALKAAINAMKADMHNIVENHERTIGDIQKRIHGMGVGITTAGAAPGAADAGKPVKRVQLVNGKLQVVP